MDDRMKDSMETFLKEDLQEKDYQEWLRYKVKFKKSPRVKDLEHAKPQEAAATASKEPIRTEGQLKSKAQGTQSEPEEATDYFESKAIITPDPPVHLRHPEKQMRRHTDTAGCPRPRKQVRFSTPEIGESLRLRRYRGTEVLRQSLAQSMSVYNPRISVIESELGISVMPGVSKRLKKGQRGHRILCLDGGGAKGVIELEMLKAIERMSGLTIPELFDWIVGTSIGGNKTPSDLLKICFKMKNSVFKKKGWFKYSFDSKALEDLLIDMFGKEKKMDAKRPGVMVTAVCKENTRLPLIFFNNCFHDCYSDKPVWEVARSTSAAPIYFKSHKDLYIDGGLVANNPCNHGLTKIKAFLRELKEKEKKKGSKQVIATDISCVVSLGCGDYPPKDIGNMDIEDISFKNLIHVYDRVKNVIQTLTGCLGRSDDDAHICRIFCEEMEIPFYRFNPPVSKEVGSTETDDLTLCDLIISAKKMVFKQEAHLERLIRDLGEEPVQVTRIPVIK